MKERGDLEKVGVDISIILKCLQINRLDLCVSEYAEVAGCCKHTNELSTKYGELQLIVFEANHFG